jgi:hypothetical protein
MAEVNKHAYADYKPDGCKDDSRSGASVASVRSCSELVRLHGEALSALGSWGVLCGLEVATAWPSQAASCLGDEPEPFIDDRTVASLAALAAAIAAALFVASLLWPRWSWRHTCANALHGTLLCSCVCWLAVQAEAQRAPQVCAGSGTLWALLSMFALHCSKESSLFGGTAAISAADAISASAALGVLPVAGNREGDVRFADRGPSTPAAAAQACGVCGHAAATSSSTVADFSDPAADDDELADMVKVKTDLINAIRAREGSVVLCNSGTEWQESGEQASRPDPMEQQKHSNNRGALVFGDARPLDFKSPSSPSSTVSPSASQEAAPRLFGTGLLGGGGQGGRGAKASSSRSDCVSPTPAPPPIFKPLPPSETMAADTS